MEKHGFDGDGYSYLRNSTWWAGIITMVLGEIFNFAAYAFAPAILVTPLGALSVLIGAVLGSYFLNEQLGLLGKIGCAICLIGSVIIVLHAPPDKEVSSVDEILNLALQPGMFPATQLLHRPQLTWAVSRLPLLLRIRRRLLHPDDLQGRAQARPQESAHLPFHLLDDRLRVHHVHQSLRNRAQDDFRRKQPVLAPVNLRLCHYDCWLHSDTDELL
jgi:hypothetical protein